MPAHFLSSLLKYTAPPLNQKRASALPRSQHVGHRSHPATSTATVRSLAAPGYRYRGSPRPEPREAQLEQLQNTFEQHRRLLAFKSASVRETASKLNRALAVALADGVKLGELSEAARLPRKEVALAGMSFDDLHMEGLPAQVHVTAIQDQARELAAMKREKAAVEADQLALMATTRRQRLMDDFDLARLTGLRHDHIRRLTWGIRTDRTSATSA